MLFVSFEKALRFGSQLLSFAPLSIAKEGEKCGHMGSGGDAELGWTLLDGS